MVDESDRQKSIRRLRRDGRTDEDIDVVGYTREDGSVRAWTGDDEGPYVKVINDDALASEIQGNILHDSADGVSKPVKMGGHANAGLRAAVGENDRVDASYDLRGRQRVLSTLSPIVISRNSTVALVETQVVKAAAGSLWQLVVSSTSAAALFLQVHNLAAVPGAGAVPIYSIHLPAGGSAGFAFDQGDPFAVGIVWVASTTIATYTAVGANIAFGTTRFI